MQVKYDLSCEPEETPVKGNFATGDDAEDRRMEQQILADLRQGNEWAWCHAKVTASVRLDNNERVEVSTYLGCCSYDSEAQFKADPYYSDMCAEALEQLKHELASMATRGELARKALAEVT